MTANQNYSGGGEKTVAKLVILEKYINAYLSIMNNPDNWAGPTWYVDTHAGTGYSNEFDTLIPGSTLRALSHDFDKYYFYEVNSDRYNLLVENLEDHLNEQFWRNPSPNEGPPRAGCEDPTIRVMNDDSNDGVIWLVKQANSHSHWFTFVDPEKFTVTFDLMETLRRRGNMDILFNFQTDAFFRNASPDAEHSHELVTEGLGPDWPIDAGPDELVEHYKQTVYEDQGWIARSRKMVSEGSNPWRYDLIFSSKSNTADGIMGDIFGSPNIKTDVTNEITKYRNQRDGGQKSLNWIQIDTHDGEDDGDPQAGLDDFI